MELSCSRGLIKAEGHRQNGACDKYTWFVKAVCTDEGNNRNIQKHESLCGIRKSISWSDWKKHPHVSYSMQRYQVTTQKTVTVLGNQPCCCFHTRLALCETYRDPLVEFWWRFVCPGNWPIGLLRQICVCTHMCASIHMCRWMYQPVF